MDGKGSALGEWSMVCMVHGTISRLLMSKQVYSMVILLPFTVPNSCTNPGLARWRNTLVWSG